MGKNYTWQSILNSTTIDTHHSIPTNAIHRTIYQLLISTVIFFSESLTNTYINIFTVEIADELNSAFEISCGDSDDDYDTDCNDCDSQNSSQSDSSEHKVKISFQFQDKKSLVY